MGLINVSKYLDSLFSIAEKKCIVTGASRGIGYAIARGFASAGATVLGIGRSELADEEKGQNFEYQQCDIVDRFQVEALISAFAEKHGAIDIIVNAAGITAPLVDGVFDAESFSKTIATNLSAVNLISNLALNALKKNGGSIINVSSIASVQGFPGNPAYVASKGGLSALSRAMAVDFAKFNIRVNNLVPGYILTSMTRKSYEDEVKNLQRIQRTLLGRWGNVNDLVGAAIFLASPSASYITGSDIVVDGGWLVKGL